MMGADPADLAVFFDTEEFGEAVQLDGAPAAAIWNNGTTELAMGDTAVLMDSNTFRFPISAAPVRGSTILVPRTGEHFIVSADPRRENHDTEWLCEAEPA